MSKFCLKSSKVGDDKVIYLYCHLGYVFPVIKNYSVTMVMFQLTLLEEYQNGEPGKDQEEECQDQGHLLASVLSTTPGFASDMHPDYHL